MTLNGSDFRLGGSGVIAKRDTGHLTYAVECWFFIFKYNVLQGLEARGKRCYIQDLNLKLTSG